MSLISPSEHASELVSISNININIAPVDVDADATLSRTQALFAALKACRNSLIPIYRLPDDILREIFISVKADWVFPFDAAFDLSHVCQRWRAVALATPNLWDHIDVEWQSWTADLIERSKSRPLKVTWQIQSAYTPPSSIEYLKLVLSPTIVDRIRYLQLCLQREFYEEIEPLLMTNALNLEALILEIANAEHLPGAVHAGLRRRRPTDTRCFFVFSDIAMFSPKLTQLQLERVAIPLSTSLTQWGRLTDLSIKNMPPHHCILPMDILSVIRCLPCLKILCVQNSLRDIPRGLVSLAQGVPDDSNGSLSLRGLQKLDVDGPHDLTALLFLTKHLEVSSSCSVNLAAHCSIYPMPGTEDDYVPLILPRSMWSNTPKELVISEANGSRDLVITAKIGDLGSAWEATITLRSWSGSLASDSCGIWRICNLNQLETLTVGVSFLQGALKIFDHISSTHEHWQRRGVNALRTLRLTHRYTIEAFGSFLAERSAALPELRSLFLIDSFGPVEYDGEVRLVAVLKARASEGCTLEELFVDGTRLPVQEWEGIADRTSVFLWSENVRNNDHL